jgi:hypothetical protein
MAARIEREHQRSAAPVLPKRDGPVGYSSDQAQCDCSSTERTAPGDTRLRDTRRTLWPMRCVDRLNPQPEAAVQVGGGGGIRTHGRREPSVVFKTTALNHSATPPRLKHTQRSGLSRPVQSTALPPLRPNQFSGLYTFYQATPPVSGVCLQPAGCSRRSAESHESAPGGCRTGEAHDEQ